MQIYKFKYALQIIRYAGIGQLTVFNLMNRTNHVFNGMCGGAGKRHRRYTQSDNRIEYHIQKLRQNVA